MLVNSRRQFLSGGAAATAALASAAFTAPALAGDKWTTVARKSGITVTIRREQGRQFPTFRGTGRVDADLWKLVAIIRDASKHTQWVDHCTESGLLKAIDDMTHILYNRIDVPWPAKDRDAVIHGKITFTDPSREVKVHFRGVTTSLRKTPPDALAIPHIEGHWYLVSMGKGKTLVEYQVNADPGGELPQWIVELGSNEQPMVTLLNLRAQVKRTGSLYDEYIAETQAKLRRAGRWPSDAD